MDFFHKPEQGPKVSLLDPRLSSYLQPSYRQEAPQAPKIDEAKERQMIDLWLMERGKFQPIYMPPRKPRVPLNYTKKSLKTCMEIADKMHVIEQELRSNLETMSTSEWKQKTLDIGALKDDFDKLMMLFEDNAQLSSLKHNVKKRAKKRLNLKKRRKAKQELQSVQKEKQKEAHANIDRWLEKQKDEAEKVKREEKIKKDADCVLYEVTKKKSEARKQLSLVSALVKLRTVRDAMATQRGERVCLEDKHAFGSVTEKLVRMWENSYQNYCKEEDCLKIMLQEKGSEDSQVQARNRSQVGAEWDQLIFGPKYFINNSTYWALTSADRDLETFIAIRRSWDTFVAKPQSTKGTSIPIGWVLPPNSPSENWAKHLTRQ